MTLEQIEIRVATTAEAGCYGDKGEFGVRASGGLFEDRGRDGSGIAYLKGGRVVASYNPGNGFGRGS